MFLTQREVIDSARSYIAKPYEAVASSLTDVVVKYKIETKSAVKGAIILVIVLFWKETLE